MFKLRWSMTVQYTSSIRRKYPSRLSSTPPPPSRPTPRDTPVNEGLRRLRLTDRSLPWSEIEDIMTEFSNMLRCSGYSASFRGEVIEAAIKGFRRQCQAADSGTGPPLFRPRENEKRRNKKITSKDSGYRPHHDVVGFVPPSPGGRAPSRKQDFRRSPRRRARRSG